MNLLKFAHEMSVDTVQLISQLLTCILSFTVDMCLFPPLFNFFGIPLNVLVRKPLTVRVPKVGSHCPSQCAELTTFATFVCSLEILGASDFKNPKDCPGIHRGAVKSLA